MPVDVTAPAPEPRTCLSCGYDLRAAGIDEKCPECGFQVRESIIGHARVAGRWAWKVRLGVVLMLVAAPLLAVSLLTYTRLGVIGMPLTPLNFPGPKMWGAPLVKMDETDGAVVALVALIVNTAGIYLLTTPPADGRERPLSLRRWLRVYAIASVVCLWVFITPWFGWPRLPQGETYHAFTTLLVIEIPGTILLYFYIGELAWTRLRDPPLVRRSWHLMKGALVLQALSLCALSHAVRLPTPIAEALLIPYGGAAIGLALWSLDFFLDFYRALGETSQSLE